MNRDTSWGTIGREWFWGLVCYSLVIAPFGCELRSPELGDAQVGGLDTPLDVGLFINQDTTDRLLLAGQDAERNAFFVFGTRDASGNLEEIEAISVRTADGEESFITFESGRPVHVQGADGSYVHVSYEEVSSQRLTANVELYDAASAEKSTYTIDIDLELTAAQIAELVKAATGNDLETVALSGDAASAKGGRERVRVTIFSPLYAAFVIPLVAAVALMTVILGQVLVFLLELVAATLELVLLAVFSPLFLIARILGGVVFHVELVPLSLIFDLIPPEPLVILL